jgi:tetratricopeptide (TPR) repeat protein
MAPDIVTNALVAAISAGAVAGATDTAKSAIANAYQGLKLFIKKKFGGDSDAGRAIDELEVRTRERIPLFWATTQNNLGTVLRALGERENGAERLEEAVSVYREALKERTRERVPLEWAMTQNNLGNALRALGERENGTGRLEESVTAYREALKERARERVPLQWAMTQNDLGNALGILGEKESGTGRLEEAREACGMARDVHQEAGIDRFDAWFETQLRAIDDLIASRRSDS